MFLTVKNDVSAICLEAAESTLAIVYASIKEEYKNLELELVFNKPEMKVFYNIVSFIRELDRIVYTTSQANEENSNIDSVMLEIDSTPIVEEEVALTNNAEETNIEEIELTTETEELILEDDEIEEPIDFAEEESITIEERVEEAAIVEVAKAEEIRIEEPKIVEEPKVEKVKEEVAEPVVPKVPNTPGDRMMESLKEQQKNEGLLELEGDKVNTLAYREHLINYMKLGFASSLLKKKVKDCNDTSEQSRLFNYCENIDKRTEEYEMKFKEIGLTTGQVYTFRMEVLRDIRKYQDDSIREVCEYINKLYALSENLILTLK